MEKRIKSQTTLTRTIKLHRAKLPRSETQRNEDRKARGEKESTMVEGGQDGAEVREGKRRGRGERQRRRASEVSEQIETFSSLGSRLPCEVADYIALSCKHALTASSRRRRPSSPSRPPPSRVSSSYLSRDYRGRRRLLRHRHRLHCHRHRHHRRRRSRSCPPSLHLHQDRSTVSSIS